MKKPKPFVFLVGQHVNYNNYASGRVYRTSGVIMAKLIGSWYRVQDDRSHNDYRVHESELSKTTSSRKG